jgi:type II secretory pathway component PulL
MDSPQKKQSGFSLENATFYLSLLLLAAMAGAFFYFQYLIAQASDELASVSTEAAKTKTGEQKKLEDRVLSTQQELADFSQKLGNRKSSTEFFSNFEALVLPDVYFNNCTVDMNGMSAKLSGHADSFQTLGQQIAMFRSADNILSSADLQKAVIGDDGGIDFEVGIAINPEMVAFK